MLIRVALAAFVSVFCLAALAAPSRLVILRHGEKANAWKLCSVGAARGQALAEFYLGRDAKHSLFKNGEAPSSILAITLHTLEVAAPAAASWGLPVTLFAVLPGEKSADALPDAALNRRTREAAQAVLSSPHHAGKTVVMVWEHRHIANAKLEKHHAGEAVTLRQLLGLDKVPGVPESWPTSNYDYFWIVDYDGSGKPTSFNMVRQDFGGAYAGVPANDWGAPDGLTEKSGCNLKGAD
jgi:hypothetical protein